MAQVTAQDQREVNALPPREAYSTTSIVVLAEVNVVRYVVHRTSKRAGTGGKPGVCH